MLGPIYNVLGKAIEQGNTKNTNLQFGTNVEARGIPVVVERQHNLVLLQNTNQFYFSFEFSNM